MKLSKCLGRLRPHAVDLINFNRAINLLDKAKRCDKATRAGEKKHCQGNHTHVARVEQGRDNGRNVELGDKIKRGIRE